MAKIQSCRTQWRRIGPANGEVKIVVHGEIVESLWEEDFTTVEDQQIIEDLRERLKLFGLDPSQAEEMVKKAQLPSS